MLAFVMITVTRYMLNKRHVDVHQRGFLSSSESFLTLSISDNMWLGVLVLG